MSYTIKQLRNLLDTKKLSVKELIDSYFAKIKEQNPIYNAFITISEKEAYAQGEVAQKLIDDGCAKPLTGIPLGLEDSITTKGIRTTCASKMLHDYVPVFDATIVERLAKAGAIIIGKTNMDEFAIGNTSETSYYGVVKNPINTEYVAGGSSGGSAASVAADLAVASIGIDTGGSLRQPAAFCGVTGLKPTYGRVPKNGIIALASSFEQVGIIAKNAEDCGTILNAIAGKDETDMTSSNVAVEDYNCKIGESLAGKVVGVPKELFENINEEIKGKVLSAIERFKEMGCIIKEVSLKSLKYTASAFHILSSAEASSNLSRYDGIKYGYRSEKGDTYAENITATRTEGFGRAVKRRILLGVYSLSIGNYETYYKKALLVRSMINEEYNAIFEECDFIINPTTPTTAYKLGENNDNPLKLYKDEAYTASTNLAGLPAITTICGYDKEGLPIGLQITGKEFAEKEIIAACAEFEKEFVKKEACYGL